MDKLSKKCVVKTRIGILKILGNLITNCNLECSLELIFHENKDIIIKIGPYVILEFHPKIDSNKESYHG